MSTILVTGGAGYIGSYMCKLLSRNGHHPVVIDNYCQGHREAARWGTIIEGDIANPDCLQHVFANHPIDAVMHFAAHCYVGESVSEPYKYYLNNVAATLALLNAMLDADVACFVFSSTCATYGEPAEIPISEQHPQNPINPYGRSKFMVEQILRDFERAHRLKYISLRYFNAAGADPEGEIGEDHRPETHLIPLTLKVALGQHPEVTIFGDDYPTRDGTCVRDYIHIADLAQAHLLALGKLLNGGASAIYNLGNGHGFSVLEIVELARRITGASIPSVVSRRRHGDPAVLVGSSEKVIRELGWRPQFADLESILQTAWEWHKAHPGGYRH